MRKVAIVARLDHPGGVQSCALTLMRGLNQRGITPEVLWDLAPSRSLLESWAAHCTFEPLSFRVPTVVIDRLPGAMRYLAWTANVIGPERWPRRYDAVFSYFNGFLVPSDFPHVYYCSGPPLLPQLAEPRHGVKGTPLRIAQSIYSSILRNRWPLYEVHANGRYVINSQFTADLFKEAHGREVTVVYPPVEIATRAYDDDDLPKRDSVLFFSRLVEYKRPDVVLSLAAKHRDLRYVVMGGVQPHRRGYFESLDSRIQREGLPVTLLANPSEERVRTELRRARFYVFPAPNEHFGMTTVEAIASGAIPFVHDSGGQKEIVPQPHLRFDEETIESRFEALLALSEADLRSLRQGLRGHVAKYSDTRYVSEMLEYVEMK